ncbi:MAG: hypothetical protein H5T86_04555 [Armatimonadetes bacterium]|nr:hypothetical protein [Armatimonadota bacterium]
MRKQLSSHAAARGRQCAAAFVLLLTALPVCAELQGTPQPGRTGDADGLHLARKLVAQAEDLVDHGRADDALPLLQEAIALAPSWLRPKGVLGLVMQVQGKQDEAIANYAAMQAGILTGPSEQVNLVSRCCAELMWCVNSERIKARVRPLKPHPLLALVATYHSQDMRDRGFFSHTSPLPGRRTPADRFAEIFGFQPAKVAENIASLRSNQFALTLDNIRRSHQELMASPGHAANILDRDFTDFGIGLAADRNGSYWITEMFVRFLR